MENHDFLKPLQCLFSSLFGIINTFPHLTYKASLPANTTTYTIILSSLSIQDKIHAQDVPWMWLCLGFQAEIIRIGSAKDLIPKPMGMTTYLTFCAHFLLQDGF